MFKTITTAILIVLALALLPGCAQPDTDAPAPAMPVEAVPAVPADPEPAAETRVDPAEQLRQQMADYVAPFPSRTTLFVPPKDIPTASSGPTDEGSVQLRGVVNVGEPQAILDIEGAIALIPVGSEKYGVKVVSIDNRKVVLKRGSTSWTATLE